jgi:hypothetical protein
VNALAEKMLLYALWVQGLESSKDQIFHDALGPYAFEVQKLMKIEVARLALELFHVEPPSG